MFRNHPLFFGGGPSGEMPAGLSAAEQESLLQKESELAAERDLAQREFLAEQEAQRSAREDAQRMLQQQEEEARLSELERLEKMGADVSESIEEPKDVDTSVADMFASLAFGTDFITESEEETTEELRPE